MDNNQKVFDEYDQVQFEWRKAVKQPKAGNYNEGHGRSAMNAEVSCFELSFHKKHRDTALKLYLPHIVSQFLQIKEENKTLKIHMLRHESRKPWVSMKLDHPATFETVAMDPDTKKMIMDDLDIFARRKDFYRRVGKAWKRGYLLFGPPGTGKSSLIAAIANYLKFDIYDLELTNLRYGFDPRSLLAATENKSILVVEDIDCSLDLENRKNQVKAKDDQIQPMKEKGSQISLSSLLNFIDGLWSSCGDERIIIFTTNHKERLDPALLRPGRMDVHIHMSYCTPFGFRKLASSYLGISEHPLFMEVEELMLMAKVTPAEVGEQLMKSEESETALRGLLKFLKMKMEENVLELNSSLEKEDKKDEVFEPC